MKKHYCYLLKNSCDTDKNRTYNGYTVNPARRIRQHNQEITGGAKYTKKYGNKSWEIYALLSGFPDMKNALQCEWRIKKPTGKKRRPNKYNTPEGRIIGLLETIKRDKWTANSLFNNKDLKLILYIKTEFKYLLNNHHDIPDNIIIKYVDDILEELSENDLIINDDKNNSI